MADATFTFPRDFLWGTATASHQVEGGNINNDWYVWEQGMDGRIFQNQIAGKACDWWGGQAEKDIKRMKALHNNAHRLSIEWSRIEPKPGKWDHEAIDRYRAILTAMRAAGIRPMITLHHFTNPIWFAEKGGWLSEDSMGLFQRYTKKAVGELGDLCDLWCTLNEPSVYASQGHFAGLWPPGHKDINEYFKVVYHLLLAHAAAYTTIRDLQAKAQIGIAQHVVAWHSRMAASPLDRMITNLLDRMFNGLFLDTIHTGQWNPTIGPKANLAQVKNTLDWIGLNYYQRYDAYFNLAALKQLGISYGARPGKPRGPKHWGEYYPQGLFEMIKVCYRRFRLPIYITENGVPDERDALRPSFLIEHLHQIWRAIQFNWPVMGYFHWSLVDNFEWAEAYDPRFNFGLYGVDFKSQKRTLRKSGELYGEIAQSYTLTSDIVRRYAPDLAPVMFPGDRPAGMM